MVKRDAAGNFSAGTITANLAGSAALASNVVAGIAITNAFITNSVFAGNGGGLTNLNASQLTSIGNTSAGATNNFFIGTSGNSATSGQGNTAVGLQAFQADTGGSFNTVNGYQALGHNTGGDDNTARDIGPWSSTRAATTIRSLAI